MELDYLNALLTHNYLLDNTDLSNTKFFRILDGGDKMPIPLKTFNNRKEKLVIRYSSIGCNTCIDLIFKRRERIAAIQKKYEMVILVDFDRYEDFVRWKRISEFNNSNIYWVPKGGIFLDSQFKESSYTFLLDKNMKAHSFFVPYNVFPRRVHDYLEKVLTEKKELQ